jgi:putative component of toxin-antitoxin plasmid stabilization module
MASVEVREYQTAEGKTPLTDWMQGLRDGAIRARIVARLDRLKAGLLGDWKTVAAEYYGQEGKTLILLLCGGDKSTQAKDIERAHAYWKDYKARLPKPPVQSSGSPAKRGRGRGVH